MAYEGKHFNHTLVASADLSSQTLGTGAIYKSIALDDGDFAQNGNESFGIITKGGRATEHSTVAYLGVAKYTAGAAINKGASLTVTNSGYMRTADFGDHVVGRNLENSVASGAIGTGAFNFAQPVPFQSDVLEFTTIDDLSSPTILGVAVDVIAGGIAIPANANAVLVTNATSGQTARAQPIGVTKVRAGDVVTAGSMIMVAATSGFWIDADSGFTSYGRAYAASAAPNSGNTFSAAVNMANPHYITSCLDLLL